MLCLDLRRFFLFSFLCMIFISSIFSLEANNGDGNLLKRTSDEMCHSCHKTDLNSPSDPDSIKTHNSIITGSSKWGSAWGVKGGKFGEFTCTTCHTAHDTRNIMLIKETLRAPNYPIDDFPGNTVDFRVFSGDIGTVGVMGDDSDGHESSTRICEVCHSQNKYHNYNTINNTDDLNHNNATNCTFCHPHTVGFKSTCNACHNSPPSTGKHGLHFALGSTSYGSTEIQSTATAYSFNCGICHSGTHQNTSNNPHTVEVNFAGIAIQDPYNQNPATYSPATYSVDDPKTGWTFNYSDGTCSNLYCHGNYPGSGKNASPSFETGSAPCGSCHGASNNPYYPTLINHVPLSGSHEIHVLTDRYFYQCILCHKDIVDGSYLSGYFIADKSKHVNGVVDLKFDLSDSRILLNSTYSIPTGTKMPSDGSSTRPYGFCSNIYCHSIAQTSTGGSLTGQPGEYKETPIWGDSSSWRICEICHNGGHGLAPINSGSHGRHLDYYFNLGSPNAATSCTICHKWNVDAPYGDCYQCHNNSNTHNLHVNHKVNVIFDPYWGNNATYTGTPDPGDGFGQCYSTYCHSNGTGGTKNSGETRPVSDNASPVWGYGSHLICNGCHGYPPNYPNGSPKANSHSYHSFTCWNCHRRTGSFSDNTVNTEYHVNGIYDVVPATDDTGIYFSYQYFPDGGTCTNVSCHGNRKWDGTYPLTSRLYFKSNEDENIIYEPAPNSYLASSGTYYGTTTYSTGITGSPGRRYMSPDIGYREESITQNLSLSEGYYRVAQFVSPRFAKSYYFPSGSPFYLYLRNVKSVSGNDAYVRYTLYQWNANDTEGTNFRTIVQDSANISIIAQNVTIPFYSNAPVTFSFGDRLICEIEFYGNAFLVAGSVTHYWGNSNSNAGLGLPMPVSFMPERMTYP